MLSDDEELPPVTDSEDEKPKYTRECINLERWKVLPTKPGRICLEDTVFGMNWVDFGCFLLSVESPYFAPPVALPPCFATVF